MLAKVVILCAALAAVCAQHRSAGLGTSGAYGAGGRGSNTHVGYAGNGAIGGRGISGYGNGAQVASGSVGYTGRGAVSGRGSGGYGVGAPAAAAPVGYSGQGSIGGRGIGGYGAGATRTIGGSAGIVRGGEHSNVGRIY